MRVVHVASDGQLELNWMWLPTFIGQNFVLLEELRQAVLEKFRGLALDDGVVWQIHYFALDWLVQKLNIPGLERYLGALAEVQQ